MNELQAYSEVDKELERGYRGCPKSKQISSKVVGCRNILLRARGSQVLRSGITLGWMRDLVHCLIFCRPNCCNPPCRSHVNYAYALQGYSAVFSR